MSFTAIVLAAGSSSRLGRPKQELRLAGETLLERAVRVATEAGLRPVIVVLRAGVVAPADADIVWNDAAAEGMASSVRCGVERAVACGCEGAVLMTCDQVGVRAEHLRALSARADRVMASAYAGRKGVPAYFSASEFATLLTLRGDQGARELLRAAEAIECEELSLDIDTEEDFARARLLFENDARHSTPGSE